MTKCDVFEWCCVGFVLTLAIWLLTSCCSSTMQATVRLDHRNRVCWVESSSGGVAMLEQDRCDALLQISRLEMSR